MTERRPLALIVATAHHRVIGNDGGLPWNYPEDLRHFRQYTIDHAVIMGRRTFDSIGKPLGRRRNLVVSRTRHGGASWPAGVEVFADLPTALDAAYQTDPQPRVIGGAQIYEVTLPLATEVMETVLDIDVPGDVVFPELPHDHWQVAERWSGSTPGVTFVRWVRVAVASELRPAL